MAQPKLWLLRDGARIKGIPPIADSDHALRQAAHIYAHYAVFLGACPLCHAAPFKVQGTGRRIASDDRAYEVDGVSVCCSKYVGIIRLEVNTLFGIHEDEAVLGG